MLIFPTLKSVPFIVQSWIKQKQLKKNEVKSENTSPVIYK